MKNFLASRKLIYALLVGVVVLGLINLVMFFVRKNQQLPENSLTPLNVPEQATQLKLNYTFVGDLPEFKDRFKVYAIEEGDQYSEEDVRQLGVQFEMTSEPKLVNENTGLYLFSEPDRSLFVSQSTLEIAYDDNSYKPDINDKPLSIEEYISKAKQYLKKIQIPSDPFTLGNPYVQPYAVLDTAEGLVKVDDPNEASLIEVRQDLSLNGIPLLSKDKQNTNITVRMNLDGSINKVRTILFSPHITSMGETYLTRPSDALTAINNGGGTVTLLEDPTQDITELKASEISKAAFNSLDLVYVVDNNKQIIYPFYRFSGVAEKKDKTEVDVAVLIVALQQDLFKQ